MKKTRIDHQQDLIMNLIRPLVRLWMRKDAKRRVTLHDGLSFKRKEPYIMLANHTFLFDVIHVPLRFKNVPFIVASQTLFKKQPTKFLVTQVAHVIPKSKGSSDSTTVRELITAVKKGYPILIFPEGDTTFYGQTNYIETSTMKLIKKLGIDVVTCHVKGGYLSKPRWATGKRRRRQIALDYRITIPKEQIIDLSLDEINQKVVHALYHNDYEYQREVMIPHPGKHLAEGIENVVYVCPHCQAINSIESDGNHIRCNACKHEGFIDTYGFIQNFKFDNLIDWNTYQKQFSNQLRASKIESSGFMNYMSLVDDLLEPVGQVNIVYENKTFTFSGALDLEISVDEIENATITLRRDFGFYWNQKHYLIKLDKFGASLLRIVQDKY